MIYIRVRGGEIALAYAELGDMELNKVSEEEELNAIPND